MTDEELNLAIAQMRGWTDCQRNGFSAWLGIPPKEKNRGNNYRLLPNFCHDLNAIQHEVMALWHTPYDAMLPDKFIKALRGVCKNASHYPEIATARQRAEALYSILCEEQRQKEQYVKIRDDAKVYFKDKEMTIIHREDGPAVEYNDGDRTWFKDGKIHNENGPAVIISASSKDPYYGWYLNGQRLTEKEHAKIVKALREL